MENTSKSNSNFEAIAWGALFIMWGLMSMFTSLPNGLGAVGIGLIMVGLNATRYMTGRPINWFSTTIGFLALLLGGLELARSLLGFTFQLPTFTILLIALGASIVFRSMKK